MGRPRIYKTEEDTIKLRRARAYSIYRDWIFSEATKYLEADLQYHISIQEVKKHSLFSSSVFARKYLYFKNPQLVIEQTRKFKDEYLKNKTKIII